MRARKKANPRHAILPTVFRLHPNLVGAQLQRLFHGARAGALAMLLAGFMGPAAHATLAAVVPARDGLVIAADSRLTFMGAECDGAFKILIPTRPAHTAVIVTGDSFFVMPGPEGKHGSCRYLATAPRLLDIGSVVTHALEQQAGNDAAQISVAGLTRACIRALARFQRRYPSVLRAYAGRDLFSVVIASYDPARHAATVRNFVLRRNARTGRIETGRSNETVLTPRSRRGIWIYGETGWFNRRVYAGPGRRFLTAPTLQLLDPRTTIAATTRAEAVAAAENVVAAAIRTARILPPSSGIGGPIRVVFVGASPHPERMAITH